MDKIPCKKCLLSDIEPGEELKRINALIERLPKSEKVTDGEYKRRLDICRECDYLSEATCLQCGCYVELRAIKQDAKCPYKNKWKKKDS